MENGGDQGGRVGVTIQDPPQWRDQVHFTGGGQQFNDIISNDVISGVARNFKGGGGIISTFFSSVFFSAELI